MQQVPTNHHVRPARSVRDVAVVRGLIDEYVRGLGIEIAIRGFEAEMPLFPGPYAPPAGELLLARSENGEALGCVCLRPLEVTGACEVKRLYVRRAARGAGIGAALARSIVERASALGYSEAMLDTLPWMTSAIAIYRSLGFEPISPYWDNLVPGILYYGRKLHRG
jgi:GNAT superfamily N-acetyltransferase